jgi:hypothetical protein
MHFLHPSIVSFRCFLPPSKQVTAFYIHDSGTIKAVVDTLMFGDSGSRRDNYVSEMDITVTSIF